MDSSDLKSGQLSLIFIKSQKFCNRINRIPGKEAPDFTGIVKHAVKGF